MGSFSIKDDNFKNGNDSRRAFGDSPKWMRQFNKPVVYVILSVSIIVIVNIVLFCFFQKTESLIEIPDNIGVKEYKENSTLKDQNIYKLLLKNSNNVHSPVVIDNSLTQEKNQEDYISSGDSSGTHYKNQDLDKINFNNIRSLDIDTKSGEDSNLSVSQKILDIDNNGNTSTKVYRLNVGVFLTHSLAEEYVQKLKKTHQILTNVNYYILPCQFKDRILYKVLIGSFNSDSDAETVSEKLESMEINNTVEEY